MGVNWLVLQLWSSRCWNWSHFQPWFSFVSWRIRLENFSGPGFQLSTATSQSILFCNVFGLHSKFSHVVYFTLHCSASLRNSASELLSHYAETCQLCQQWQTCMRRFMNPTSLGSWLAVQDVSHTQHSGSGIEHDRRDAWKKGKFPSWDGQGAGRMCTSLLGKCWRELDLAKFFEVQEKLIKVQTKEAYQYIWTRQHSEAARQQRSH